MLGDGTLRRYIDELSITGLTSNPTIFDKAIIAGDAYDEQIGELHERGLEPEPAFFELALLGKLAAPVEVFQRKHRGRWRWASDDACSTQSRIRPRHLAVDWTEVTDVVCWRRGQLRRSGQCVRDST
jgi:hypothetical protein